MPANGLQLTDWTTEGPRVLAWLRTEVPRRTGVTGLYADCATALGLRSPDTLRLWLSRQALKDWLPIKRTLGTNGNGLRASTPAPAGGSIVDRLRMQRLDGRRAACPVCQLPPAIRTQVTVARTAGFTVSEVVAILTGDGYAVTGADFNTHSAGGHDR